MKIFQPGDRQRAFTPEGRPVDVVFTYQTVQLDDIDLHVANVLVGINQEHPGFRVVPAQSIAKLAAARKTIKNTPVVVQIPKVFEDVMAVLAARFGAHISDFQPVLVRHYLWQAKDSAKVSLRLQHLAQKAIASSAPMTQFKVRVPNELWKWLTEVGRHTRGCRTALVRGAILAAKEDLLDKPRSKQAQAFSAIARAL